MLIPLHEVIAAYNINLKGILHVGAHQCEENDAYLAEGVKQDDIFWVEANSKIAETLTLPNVITAAVSDVIETVTFNVTNNGQSSSILPLKDHRVVHPEVHVVSTESMTTQRLEDIIRERGIRANFLNLDIQGAELKALKGLGSFIDQFDCIYTEVNTRELYAGCALLPQLDDWLRWHGFWRMRTVMYEQCGWGDAVYVRCNDEYCMMSYGRTGNHLFQLAACELLKKATGRPFVVHFDEPWKLGSVLTYTPKIGTNPAFQINDEYFEDWGILKGKEETIKELFAFRAPLVGKNECIVHLRLGDLADQTSKMGAAYPLSMVKHLPKGVPVHIMSETPTHPYVQVCLSIFRREGYAADVLPAQSFENDFLRLVQARYVLGSSSTLIFWVGLLGALNLPGKQTSVFLSSNMPMSGRHAAMYTNDPPWFCKLVDMDRGQ
jgi:FkbM family methyltransferase